MIPVLVERPNTPRQENKRRPTALRVIIFIIMVGRNNRMRCFSTGIAFIMVFVGFPKRTRISRHGHQSHITVPICDRQLQITSKMGRMSRHMERSLTSYSCQIVLAG
jgi:hypothetical protein